MVMPFENMSEADKKNNFTKTENIGIEKRKKIKISPSILSLGLNEIANRIKKIEDNIDYIHIDVMDGKFVSNLTNGVEMFNEAKKASNKPLDVHLMVENPINEIEKYKGAEIITFHIEAVKNDLQALEVIKRIRELGAKVGISIRPTTAVSSLTKFLDMIDLVLVMTVEPGYGGQKLIVETLNKVTGLRKNGFNKLIEVDGGVTVENAEEVKKTDVDIIVAGTAIFVADNENEVIELIRNR